MKNLLHPAILLLLSSMLIHGCNSGNNGGTSAPVQAASRFSDNGDGTVTDKLTGLMWLKDGNIMPTRDNNWDQDGTANDGMVTWQHALDYVAKLNAENYLGHTDWRLPNRNQLKSLIDYARYYFALPLGHPFVSVQADYYWTSTLLSNAPDVDVWTVQMRDGNVYDNVKNGSSYVWPVCLGGGTAQVELPQTGQGKCYDAGGTETVCVNTGQDGERKDGIAWPNPRFADNADGTMTDNLSRLMWSKDGNIMPTRDNNWDQDGTANDGMVTWQHALDYVAKLNAENYLGHTDWRLPNVNELGSLVHAGYSEVICSSPNPCSSVADWLNKEGFSNVQSFQYWSSTTLVGETSRAWQVHLLAGNVFYSGKTVNHYVLPVRSGQ